MSTLAFDPATVAAAMNYLSAHAGGAAWQPNSAGQVALIEWYREHGAEADALKGLQFVASKEVDELNEFMAGFGFNPQFRGFVTNTAVGMASVISLLPKWAVAGQISSINHHGKSYRGFSLPSRVAKVFETKVPGTEGTVACLTTDDDLTLWLTTLAPKEDEATALPRQVYEFISLATEVITSPLKATSFAGVTMPNIKFTVHRPVEWLVEMYAGQPECFVIDQAFQGINVQIDGSGIAALFPAPAAGSSFVFDKPFVGWVTQPGVNLPICAFLADTSCWREIDA